jgi:hypothetical protein
MVKAHFCDLIDKELSGCASEEELQELRHLISQLLPRKRMEEEEIEQAYNRLVQRMKKEGILF